jgi:hypothetical protein
LHYRAYAERMAACADADDRDTMPVPISAAALT